MMNLISIRIITEDVNELLVRDPDGNLVNLFTPSNSSFLK